MIEIKEQKGITLVALVVTILVLLTIGGITIGANNTSIPETIIYNATI